MNRIDQVFKTKKEGILSVYFTAGFPEAGDAVRIMECLEEAGADMLEVGMPFSDPVADGPVIQESNRVALENGMSIALLLDQLEGIREKVKLPIILMGYLNPIVQYGVEKFCKQCHAIGIDGLIIPDLPMTEYREMYQSVFESYRLHPVFLITPQTSEERIRMTDKQSKGFIYMVSSASTTGAKEGIAASQEAYFQSVKAMKLDTPTLIGFGISNRETFGKACENAQGAIIGSAFIQVLAQSKNIPEDIRAFIQSIKTTNPAS